MGLFKFPLEKPKCWKCICPDLPVNGRPGVWSAFLTGSEEVSQTQLFACIFHVIFFIFSITFQYLPMLFQHVPTSDARWARIGSQFFHAFVAFLVQNSCCWCWCWKALGLRGVPSFKNAPRGLTQGVLRGIAWRLNNVHSWKEGCNHSQIAFSVALFFACFPSSAKCFKTFMLSCRRPKPRGLEWCSLGWAVKNT